MRALVWFRTDLRVADNSALLAAAAEADELLALFVVSPGEWKLHEFAPVRVDLWLRSVRELARSLRGLGIAMEIRLAPRLRDVPGVVHDAARGLACDAVYVNAEYELNESRRDERTSERCAESGIRFRSCHDQVFAPPGEVRTGEGRFFTVFTPFRKAVYARMKKEGIPAPRGKPRKRAMFEAPAAHSGRPNAVASQEQTLRQAFLAEQEPDWDSVLGSLGFAARPGAPALPRDLWRAGEDEGAVRLAKFARGPVLQYKAQRDFPGRPGTSVLSPYLNLGLVSCRQCLHAALEANTPGGHGGAEGLDSGSEGATTWISELVWREFYIHVMAGFPRVCMHRAFQPSTERVRWKENAAHLEGWKAGCTGVPIVDAGMRQLAATGWMHNRVRMITAMYLSKNLLLDWRHGESWFMRNLVDGFLASNNGGWQWSASTGTDAAPYFRVFNPVSQSTKFDPDGAYIRRWVPELAELDGEAIHAPWEVPALLRRGIDYPEPLVDLSRSRAEAIEAFKGLKG